MEEKWTESAPDFRMAIHITGNKTRYVRRSVSRKTDEGKQGLVQFAKSLLHWRIFLKRWKGKGL